jgi:hypothetical protein
LTKAQCRAENLDPESMVFCYPDNLLGSSVPDDEGSIVVVDFEDASIPSSSFGFVLVGT